MVGNFPRLFETPSDIPSCAETAQMEGLGERVLDRIREAFCGLYGHDTMMQFQHDRMFLKCVSCGHESPGWSLNETPRNALAGDETQPPRTLGRPGSSVNAEPQRQPLHKVA